MASAQRSLPPRPSLRHLKLEAKRRLASGEFSALHQAHAAIAREHGLQSWTALKAAASGPGQETHALAQLRWVVDRFSGADQPGWVAPEEQEMREHFDDQLLAAVTPEQLAVGISRVAAELRSDFVVVGQSALHARVQVAGTEYITSVQPDPPHRLVGLRGHRLGASVTDPRAAGPPPARTLGTVPDAIADVAADALAELGLAGLVIAGGEPGGATWTVTCGWADLDRAEDLLPRHRFPALGVTALVTLTAVLRLVADGRVSLDGPANGLLRSVQLADDTVTVRELLSHTGGVGSPDPTGLFAESVPDLATLAGGPVIRWAGSRGAVQPSNGGYAVLGQLIADVTGTPYSQAATSLVLEPLGMTSSAFPAAASHIGPDAVTGYEVTSEGSFAAEPALICAIPALGGLWATAGDLVRLGTGWSSLVPRALAREALAPQTPAGPGGLRVGLSWLIPSRGDVVVHSGVGPGSTASLLLRRRDGRVLVTLASRMTPLDRIEERVLSA
jgi:CubicO group peptidase (beta-lactamase class C family)